MRYLNGRPVAIAAMFLAVLLWGSPRTGLGDDLVLSTNGTTAYQIVLPDQSPTPEIADCLAQAARLVQTVFKANGVEIPVVAEAARDTARPGLFLGATAFAKAQGVTPRTRVKGWGYLLKVIGRDVVIAGRDEAPPFTPDAKDSRRAPSTRMGTVKGVTDFLRQYAGTRILYPDLPNLVSVQAAASIDLLASPAFEFLPTPTIAVPATLDVTFSPSIDFNIGGPRRASFYDIALNRFPLVDTVFGCHTYGRAVPVDKYHDTHPEYFALVGGTRVKDDQYCISNPDFQELLYQDMIGFLKRGFETVDLGQPDGFRPCQCKSCADLFGTGDDWSEKLWLLHKQLAERVLKAYPDRYVTIMSYIQTALPPKSFKKFPKNVKIMLCGTNEEDIQPWLGHEVPGGFTSYLYNWCPNLGTRYTPMRTPLFIEAQARRLARYRIQGINRDGPGYLFGLEGPVYYIMGRMFDAPETIQAKDLMYEFCGAAFGKSAAPMLRFYDQLYHGIELYAHYLGTRCPGWSYHNIYGQRRKHLSDTYQLIGFLYTPTLLASLEQELGQAEKMSDNARIKARLALVRREFDYVKSLARVVHLTHAYQTAPDLGSRDRLLDAIDARNAQVAGYYDARGRALSVDPAWALVFFPPGGHNVNHLRLSKSGYQEPVEDTSLNWDTKAMRRAPLPGTQRLVLHTVPAAPVLNDPRWTRWPASALNRLPGHAGPAARTALRACYDKEAIYIRFESELPSNLMTQAAGASSDSLADRESLDIYLAPAGGRDVAYRFRVGLEADQKYDAANGFVTDVMDPRYGQDDPDWSGAWDYQAQLVPAGNLWLALIRIPFKTLGVDPPAPGSVWRGNFGRLSPGGSNQVEHALWSAVAGTKGMDDRSVFGELAFEDEAGTATGKPVQKNSVQAIREKLYGTSFDVPPEWKSVPNPLPAPLGPWVFRPDPMEDGVKQGWFAPGLPEANWFPMAVPSFWSENDTAGKYQGNAWYRTKFLVPADWKGKPLRLLFGGVDEQAWVYVNGSLVKEHSEQSEGKAYGQLWDVPFVAEVPADKVLYGATNVLAVRVSNAVGNGGIWRPVLGHAAPR